MNVQDLQLIKSSLRMSGKTLPGGVQQTTEEEEEEEIQGPVLLRA